MKNVFCGFKKERFGNHGSGLHIAILLITVVVCGTEAKSYECQVTHITSLDLPVRRTAVSQEGKLM